MSSHSTSLHDRYSGHMSATRIRVPASRVSEKSSPRAASELETEATVKGPVKESRSAGNRGGRPKRSSLMANSNGVAESGRKKQKEPTESEWSKTLHRRTNAFG